MYEFLVTNDTSGQPSWWLYAPNAKMVAWAGETFASLANATRAAEAFKAGAVSARFEIYEDAGGNFRWRAWRSSDRVASSGESFYDRASAKRAADNVRAQAGGASGP